MPKSPTVLLHKVKKKYAEKLSTPLMIFFLKQKLAFKFLMHVFLLMISWQKLVGLPLSKMNMMKKKQFQKPNIYYFQ